MPIARMTLYKAGIHHSMRSLDRLPTHPPDSETRNATMHISETSTTLTLSDCGLTVRRGRSFALRRVVLEGRHT